MTDTCPTCAAPVLATASGLLDPQPGRLGVHRPDGSRITTAEAIAAVREGRPAGHHRHVCPPASARARPRAATSEPAGQTALFAVPDAAGKPRGRGR